MYWMLAFKLYVFDVSFFKETFGNCFYYECFLQYFEGCSRVSSFHLNDFDNKVGNK